MILNVRRVEEAITLNIPLFSSECMMEILKYLFQGALNLVTFSGRRFNGGKYQWEGGRNWKLVK